MPTFTTRYYRKELAANKIYIRATGAPAPFEPIAGGDGILATDNPVYTEELDQAAAKGVGGVVVITEQEYQDAKKKNSERPSLKSLVRDRSSLSALNLPRVPAGLAALAVATNGVPLHGQLPDTPKAEPIKIPTEFVRPKTSKGFMKKADE